MRRLFSLSVFAMICANASAGFTPITNFIEADYLGSADWISQDGGAGNFRFYLDMHPSGWTIAQFEMANVKVYKTTAIIDNTGFMSVEMLDESDPHAIQYYPGFGSCGVDYCQMTIYLVNGKLWKQLTFNPNNTISVVGSITHDDGSPNIQWKGSAVILPSMISNASNTN